MKPPPIFVSTILILTISCGFRFSSAEGGKKVNVRRAFWFWKNIFDTLSDSSVIERKKCSASLAETLAFVYAKFLFLDHFGEGIVRHGWSRGFATQFETLYYGLKQREKSGGLVVCDWDANPEATQAKLVCLNEECRMCPEVEKEQSKVPEELQLICKSTGPLEPRTTIPPLDDSLVLNPAGEDIYEELTFSEVLEWKKGGKEKEKKFDDCDAPLGMTLSGKHLRQLVKGRSDDEIKKELEDPTGTWKNALSSLKGADKSRVMCGFDLVCGYDDVCIPCDLVKRNSNSYLFEACIVAKDEKSTDMKNAGVKAMATSGGMITTLLGLLVFLQTATKSTQLIFVLCLAGIFSVASADEAALRQHYKTLVALKQNVDAIGADEEGKPCSASPQVTVSYNELHGLFYYNEKQSTTLLFFWPRFAFYEPHLAVLNKVVEDKTIVCKHTTAEAMVCYMKEGDAKDKTCQKCSEVGKDGSNDDGTLVEVCKGKHEKAEGAEEIRGREEEVANDFRLKTRNFSVGEVSFDEIKTWRKALVEEEKRDGVDCQVTRVPKLALRYFIRLAEKKEEEVKEELKDRGEFYAEVLKELRAFNLEDGGFFCEDGRVCGFTGVCFPCGNVVGKPMKFPWFYEELTELWRICENSEEMLWTPEMWMVYYGEGGKIPEVPRRPGKEKDEGGENGSGGKRTGGWRIVAGCAVLAATMGLAVGGH